MRDFIACMVFLASKAWGYWDYHDPLSLGKSFPWFFHSNTMWCHVHIHLWLQFNTYLWLCIIYIYMLIWSICIYIYIYVVYRIDIYIYNIWYMYIYLLYILYLFHHDVHVLESKNKMLWMMFWWTLVTEGPKLESLVLV